MVSFHPQSCFLISVGRILCTGWRSEQEAGLRVGFSQRPAAPRFGALLYGGDLRRLRGLEHGKQDKAFLRHCPNPCSRERFAESPGAEPDDKSFPSNFRQGKRLWLVLPSLPPVLVQDRKPNSRTQVICLAQWTSQFFLFLAFLAMMGAAVHRTEPWTRSNDRPMVQQVVDWWLVQCRKFGNAQNN